jgi:hypothetical protein
VSAGAKRKRQSMGQSTGGVLFGFEQQVWRNVPPPEELVHDARPDGPVAAADGSTLEIRMPDEAVSGAQDAPAAADDEEDADTASEALAAPE